MGYKKSNKLTKKHKNMPRMFTIETYANIIYLFSSISEERNE